MTEGPPANEIVPTAFYNRSRMWNDALHARADMIVNLYTNPGGTPKTGVRTNGYYANNMFQRRLYDGDAVQDGPQIRPVRIKERVGTAYYVCYPWLILSVNDNGVRMDHAWELSFIISVNLRSGIITSILGLQSSGPFDANQVPTGLRGGN